MSLITRLKTVFVIVMRRSLKDHPKTIWNNQKPDTADFHLVSQRWPVEVQEFDAAFFGIAEPEARSMDTHQRLQTETAYVTWLVGSGVGWFRRKPWSLGMGESCRVFWGVLERGSWWCEPGCAMFCLVTAAAVVYVHNTAVVYILIRSFHVFWWVLTSGSLCVMYLSEMTWEVFVSNILIQCICAYLIHFVQHTRLFQPPST